VLELSSYQIDLTQTLDCDVAVLLNITPDHLDRYDSFEAYAASKKRLFEMQSPDHWAVIGAFDGYREIIDAEVQRRHKDDWDWVWPIPLDQPHPNQRYWPALQGLHNSSNADAASSVISFLGGHIVSKDDMAKGLSTFPGLPHRMERVAEHAGVLFVNDSKATNTDSAAPALSAFPPDGDGLRIHWIVGGLPKEDGLGACAQHLANVAAAYTIGEAGPRFAELLEPHVQVERSELLCEATRRAVAAARPGDVVLLSPACASFDQFRDFEVRGEHFRNIVTALTTGEGSAA
jgi:UDP-N-acetylmuramoylalanine--D-glutamate ligase